MLHAVKIDTRRKKHLKVLLNITNTLVNNNKFKWRLNSPFFLLLFFSSYSFAQQLDISLPNSSAITQDKKGFIWLASPSGLIRHNSKDNITFNTSNNNWPLPFNWINDIHFIDDENLLLATETHQLWVFDTSTGQAKKLKIDIHQKSIYQVIEHKGSYYLDVPSKLYQVNKNTLSTRLLSDNIDIKALKFTRNHVYVLSSKGLYKFDGKKLKLLVSGNVSAIETVSDKIIYANANKITVLSDNGIEQNIDVKDKILALATSNTQENFFSVDQQGKIKKYAIEKLIGVAHAYPDINPTYIEKFFHDNSNVLWLIGNHGVQQLVPSISKSTSLVFDVFINSIVLATHQNNIIVGSYGKGLSEFNSTKLQLPENINESFSERAKIITDLYSTNSTLFISTFDGLWQYNSVSKELSRVDFPENNNLLLDLTYKNGLLYLASNSNGVLVYDIDKKQLLKRIKGKQLSSSEAINVLPLDNNEIWIATASGVDIFNWQKNSSKALKGLGQNKVISLIEYKNKIFIATKGDGFFVYNLQGELLAHFAKSLNFSYISLINNEIWAPGHSGLYIINPDNYQMKMIPNTQNITFTKAPILHDGMVYAGHYGGILQVSLTPFEKLHPQIHISKTIASGNAQLLNKTIEIDSANDVITLELASLDFRPGQEKQFKYQLNGGNWNKVNGNQLTLTGLSSGDYHIEIMGTNSLGQWSDFKAFADISVAYPWYWHPNSRIIYAVLITLTLLLTMWLLYLRSRSISHIHKLFNEEMKTHGQSTSIIRRKLNKVQTLMNSQAAIDGAKKDRNEQQKLEHTVEVQALIGECLAELKTKYSHAEPSSLSGSSLTVALPYLADYFHQQYHVLMSVQLDIACEKIDYAIQTAIYRIIYEAILAAINNGNGGVFAVHINESNDKIWLKITDNEQSFAQFNSKINFDMAMYYIRQIANKFNATFHTYDNQDHGSEIIISIPLMKIS